jgi:hypothetical protein
MNLWAATQNWLPDGLDNVRMFLEILFGGNNENGEGKIREGK